MHLRMYWQPILSQLTLKLILLVVFVVRGSGRTSDLTRLSIVLHKHQPLFIIYFRPSLKKKMQNRDTWTHL